MSVAHQAPMSMGFPRQEYCSGLPFPSPIVKVIDLKMERDYRRLSRLVQSNHSSLYKQSSVPSWSQREAAEGEVGEI